MSRDIVVGVNGSPASHAALRWALERAVRERATVTVMEVGPLSSSSSNQVGDGSRLHDAVRAARGLVANPPDVVELHVDGEPAIELAQMAEGAMMLVLGSTSRNRLTEFILGGTASECLRHARCPVVVVPAA